MIQIVHGDPEEKTSGATSSFFILPFRYEITAVNKNEPELFYEEIDVSSNDGQWTERKRYFTQETACVLFENAKRYQIKSSIWDESDDSIHPKIIECKRDGKTVYKVRVAPPEVILFEIHENESAKAEKSRLFQSGILVVKTYFISDDKEPDPSFENLLHFNERFRYWRKLFDRHEGDLRELNNLIGNRKNLSREAEALELYLRRWQRLLTIPFVRKSKGKNKFYRFFPEQWCSDAEQWFLDEIRKNSSNHKETGWVVFNDNRAFVWSNAVISKGAAALQKFNSGDNIEIKPEAFGHWIKLLNVDHCLGDDFELSKVTHFEKLWCKGRTYTRWAHEGTLYGFNYHSGIMLSGECSEPPISTTFRRHYFDMILLLLYLRVTIFRFSYEMNTLTTPVLHGHKKDWEKDFLNLRKQFAIFTNLYQFPLITNQQQMLEMYAIARKHLDIDELFNEVEGEVRNTHDYFSAEKSNSLSNWMMGLTAIGVFIAVVALPWKEIFCLLGLSIYCFN